MYKESRVYLHYRVRQKKNKNLIENYSTIIYEIPQIVNEGDGLKKWFNKYFPDWNILELNKTFCVPQISKKFKKREKIVRKYESSQYFLNSKGKRDTTRVM